MKAGLIQDPMVEAMGSFMTRLSKRQQVVASNIANIDTPGYKSKDVSFHLTMQEVLSGESLPLNTRRPEGGLLQGWTPIAPEPEVFETSGLPMRADRNNVDIDSEMLKLSETSFTYAVATQLLRGKFRTISSAIQEGRSG
jgi:flagellar basal-body rod protein FlgB